MSRYIYGPESKNGYSGEVNVPAVVRDTAIAVLVLVPLLMLAIPHYSVWQQGLAGQAELKRAEQNRQIQIQEARARMESAKMLADAEIIRATGASESNRIIAEGLGGPEGYLRYLWIQSLENNKANVIYVPTEAGLPILEAGRALQLKETTP